MSELRIYVNNPGFNSVTVNVLKPNTLYYWRVRSVCSGVIGSFSCKRYFLTSCNGARTEGSEVNGSAFASPIIAYPNPAFDRAKITFDSDAEGEFTLHAIDITGRELMRLQGVTIEGTNVIDLNLNQVSAGFLYISIEKADGVFYTKIIVTK